MSLLPEPTIAREIESGSLVRVPLEGVALERTLGIIHRRDRKLNETAQQFIKLLQSQSSSAESANKLADKAAIDGNGHATKPRPMAAAVAQL